MYVHSRYGRVCETDMLYRLMDTSRGLFHDSCPGGAAQAALPGQGRFPAAAPQHTLQQRRSVCCDDLLGQPSMEHWQGRHIGVETSWLAVNQSNTGPTLKEFRIHVARTHFHSKLMPPHEYASVLYECLYWSGHFFMYRYESMSESSVMTRLVRLMYTKLSVHACSMA